MIEYRKTAVTYQGDGNTSVFPFSFAVTDANSVRVSIYDKATDVSVELTRDYFVDMTANVVHYPGYAPGESVDAHAQPPKLPRGKNITIYRVTPIDQLTDLGNKYPLPYIETMADKLTAILQEHDEMLGRVVAAQKGSDVTPKKIIDDIFKAGEKAAASSNAASDSAARAEAAESSAKESVKGAREALSAVNEKIRDAKAELINALSADFVPQTQASADKAEILSKISTIVGGAPNGLDTIGAIASALSTKLGKTEKAAGASNADALGGQTLQMILDKINAGGAITGNIEKNGWIKFPNGLIAQWGTVESGALGWREIAFPVTFPHTVFLISGFFRGHETGTATSTRWEMPIPRVKNAASFTVYYESAHYPVSYIALGN